jgi:ferritin-like protein
MKPEEMTVQELNALLETHRDAIAVVNEAMMSVTDATARQEVRMMLDDHTKAADTLAERIKELDGIPATDAHAVNLLRESWQKLWDGGGEQEALMALRANERVAVDGLQLQMTKENVLQTMTDEGVREHLKMLEMELNHFQMITERLRSMGTSVDNDEVLGAVRNAAEHVYAAVNLSGAAVESFFKWATGPRG